MKRVVLSLLALGLGSTCRNYMAKIERVRALIMLTARHGRIDGAEVDAEAALFLDCDMAIVGSAP
jgi:predicted metal-dependent HD superfamily phosphohydrolase